MINHLYLVLVVIIISSVLVFGFEYENEEIPHLNTILETTGGSVVNVSEFVENWSLYPAVSNVNINNKNISNINWLIANNIGWTNLTNYPTSCIASQFVRGVGDTLTCASETGDIAGVTATPPYILGGGTTGTVAISFNESRLNQTIGYFIKGDNLTNWSLYPAISNVDMNFFNITEGNKGFFNDMFINESLIVGGIGGYPDVIPFVCFHSVYTEFECDPYSFYWSDQGVLYLPTMQVGSGGEFNIQTDGTLAYDWNAGDNIITVGEVDLTTLKMYSADPFVSPPFLKRNGLSGYQPITLGGINGSDLIGIGSNTQIIFNDGLGLVGNSSFTYNKTTQLLTVTNINITNNLNVVGNFTGNQMYGFAFFHNDSNPNVTTLGSANVWYNISAFGGQSTNGQKLNGFSFSTTNLGLTSLVSGLYDAKYCVSFSGDANEVFHIVYSINGVTQPQTESHSRTGAALNVLQICGVGYLQLSAGDLVNLQTMDSTAGGSISVYSASMDLVRVGT